MDNESPQARLGDDYDRAKAGITSAVLRLHDQFAAAQDDLPSSGNDVYGTLWTVINKVVAGAVGATGSLKYPGSRLEIPMTGDTAVLTWRDTHGSRHYGTTGPLAQLIPGVASMEHQLELDLGQETADSPPDHVEDERRPGVIMVIVSSTATQVDQIVWGVPRLHPDGRVELLHEEELYSVATPVSSVLTTIEAHDHGAVPERAVRPRLTGSAE